MTAEEENYSQSYPVQNWQVAYAQELMKSTAKQYVGDGYLIHLDEDTVPELLFTDYMESGMVGVFSFDGTESYFVALFNKGYYDYSLHCRPYLSMLGYDEENVTEGEHDCRVVLFGKDEAGRLVCTGEVQLDDDGNAPEIAYREPDREYKTVSSYEDFALYDAPDGYFGESWRIIGEENEDDAFGKKITQSQIQYWLDNGNVQVTE